MHGDGWVCDSCESHNLSTAAVCRTCQRSPGSATGAVRAVPAATELLRRPEAPLVFGESKHAITLTPVPVPPRPVRPPPPSVLRPPYTPGAPPARPPLPPPLPRPRPAKPGGGWRVVRLLLSATAIIVLAVRCQSLIALLPSGTQSSSHQADSGGAVAPATPAAPAGVACPAAVAMWLPDGGADSVLVDGYRTDRFVITVCGDSTGQLYYDGQEAGQPANSQTHVSIPAQQTADGFTATNNGYLYRISGTNETITHRGRVITDLTLTRTGP